MAKYEMRVIPEPAEGTRYVREAHHAGSMVIKGYDGDFTFLCGSCRDILVKNCGPDTALIHEDDEGFAPLATVADVVFRCKGCGAFNEFDPAVLQGG